MQKIGIITFHASHNCGSMLQAYALQRTIQTRYPDAKVEIINFSNTAQRGLYGFFDLRISRSAVRNTANNLLHTNTVLHSRSDYLNFINNYFSLSDRSFRTEKALKQIDGYYDILIAGGDQIWNVRCADSDPAYFLSFAKNGKKIAFSPSLGATNINIFAKNKAAYRQFLLDFDSLCVRERNGKKWLEELTGRETPIIADPTLLLSQEDWESQFDLQKVSEKYIFYYAFSYADHTNTAQIQNISKETGMPVYVIDARQYRMYHLDRLGFRLYPKTGPIAFLELMRNAELVFSQSFHGTIFSAIFGRKFWAFHNSIIRNVDDDRATFILEQLGLSDRYINIENYREIDILQDYDHKLALDKIAALRGNALAYLDRNLL